MKLAREKAKLVELDEELAQARASTRASPAARRSATRSSRWRCSSRKLAILDETDSGLDIDALRVVADGVNALRSPSRAMLVITHYQRLLDYIIPDFVHVLVDGSHRPDRRQAARQELEAEGYADIEERGASMTDAHAASTTPRLARPGARRTGRLWLDALRTTAATG